MWKQLRLRPGEGDGFKSQLGQLEVAFVCRSENNSERDALLIGQETSIGAIFGSMFIGSPDIITSERCDNMGTIHGLPFPLDADTLVIKLKGNAPKHVKEAEFNPSLKTVVYGAFGSHMTGEESPLGAGKENERDGGESFSVFHRRSSRAI